MAVYRGYCDESEEPSSQILVVAGLIAPANRWESLETNWRLVLAHNKVAYFHSVEFYDRRAVALGTE